MSTYPNHYSAFIDPHDFDYVLSKLRQYCRSKGLLECNPQVFHDIMAACEDPKTVKSYHFEDAEYALPQTNQMRLERIYLGSSERNDNGYFCLTTSYRNEPSETIIPGRHYRTFDLFEVEFKGDFRDLIDFQKGMLEHLGYDPSTFVEVEYEQACEDFGVDIISSKEENMMEEKYGPAVWLNRHPMRAEPYWNMKTDPADSNYALKTDCIIGGNETLGSAERSCSVDEMRDRFDKVEEGKYKEKVFELFGEDRVMSELDSFLSLNFTTRSGFGCGLIRLINDMKKRGLIPE